MGTKLTGVATQNGCFLPIIGTTLSCPAVWLALQYT